MLKRVRSILVGMVVMFGQCFAQDIEARFAQYQLQKAQVDEGMSVLIEKVLVSEGVERVVGLDLDAPPKYQVELASNRTLQRLVVGANGLRKRLDGLSYSLLGDADMSSLDRESQLIHDNVGWYFFRTQKAPTKGIERFQVKGGVVQCLRKQGENIPLILP